MTRALLFLLVLLALPAAAAAPLRDGDIIFHTSRSAQSAAIQRATHSPYSHMGMIFLRDGKPFVFEAVATVRYTPLERWIERGDRGSYVVKRLSGGLTDAQAAKLRRAAARFERKPYDPFFEWSDGRIYCSELVWKMYEGALGIELGARQRLRDFDLSDAVVRAKLRERHGELIPLEEPVISPAALHDSPRLVTVTTD